MDSVLQTAICMWWSIQPLYGDIDRPLLLYSLRFLPQEYCQRNYVLGTYDVPLTCVGAAWLTDGGPVRRRRLMPYGDMPGKVKGLQVVCKVSLRPRQTR